MNQLPNPVALGTGLREENKNTIRGYMTKEKREKHYALLDMEKEYYNAYIISTCLFRMLMPPCKFPHIHQKHLH